MVFGESEIPIFEGGLIAAREAQQSAHRGIPPELLREIEPAEQLVTGAEAMIHTSRERGIVVPHGRDAAIISEQLRRPRLIRIAQKALSARRHTSGPKTGQRSHEHLGSRYTAQNSEDFLLAGIGSK